MLQRNDAISIQASIICMCAMTTFCSLDAGNPTSVNWHVSFWFFTISIVCVTACVHCILLTMWVSTWGHGLALQGASGSLHRALVLVSHERKNVNMWFAFTMVTYVIQTILCVWAMNDQPGFTGWAAMSTAVGLLFSLGAAIGLKRMKKRFFNWEAIIDQDEAEAARQQAQQHIEASSHYNKRQ